MHLDNTTEEETGFSSSAAMLSDLARSELRILYHTKNMAKIWDFLLLSLLHKHAGTLLADVSADIATIEMPS